MGFLKKLVKKVAKGVSKVSKGISKVAGFAGKVLPQPFGKVATIVSKVSGFAAKVTNGINKVSSGGALNLVDKIAGESKKKKSKEIAKAVGFVNPKMKRSFFFKPN